MIKPKFLVFFLLLFALSLPKVIILTSVQAIHDFKVEVKPRRVSTRASYTLYLKLDKALEVHDWIKIRFPEGTKLPELSTNPERRREELKRIVESIYIGTSPCSSCQGLPEINYIENSIRFNVHLGLDPNIEGYETIKISVTDRVGIINPDIAGWYQLSISTAKETTAVKSEAYEIVQSRIGEPKGTPRVTVSPPKTDAKAEYLITFNVGRGGGLNMNQSRIRVLFPPETHFSNKAETINPNRVLVNGYPVSIRLMIHETMLTFISPVSVKDEGSVEVRILKEVGIINPEQVGAYTLQLVTSEDLEWVNSEPYLIETNEPILSIEPDIIGKIAEYQFKFLLEAYEEFSPEKAIEIYFPKEVAVPDIINSAHVSINDQTCKKLWFEKGALWLQPNQTLQPGGIVNIRFSKEAQLKNPPNTQEIRLSFRCFGSKALRNTAPVHIREIILNWQSIELNPPNASALTEINLSFQLGSKGALLPGDELWIVFPEGTLMTDKQNETLLDVYFNEDKVTAYYLPLKHQLRVPVLKPLAGESFHKLFLPKDQKVRNPSQEKQWVVFLLSTTAEPNPVTSEEIFIPPALPETLIHIAKGKQGLESWYTETPQISFTSSQENCISYFQWENQSEHAQVFSDPFYLDPGFYIAQLNYYSENAYGKETTKSIIFKIDTIAPSFVLEQPDTLQSLTNQTNFTFKGKVLPTLLQLHDKPVSIIDQTLMINQRPVSVNNDGFFELEYYLSEGANEFLIQAYDEAGNHSEKHYSITLDTQAPLLEIFSPSSVEDTVPYASVWIKGKTEKNASLMIQGNIIEIQDDGSFSHQHAFEEIGENTIAIQATDPAGNIRQVALTIWSGTTLTLTIGSSIYQVNQFQKHYDIEALIIEGRTMVPIRLLANELGATINLEYDPKSKKLTKVIYELDQIKIELFIDQPYAIVNNRKINLDVPPRILRQRTMVPLRFVAENLNAKVNWDPQNQEITIKYWKPSS
jgi:hypothetical protein